MSYSNFGNNLIYCLLSFMTAFNSFGQSLEKELGYRIALDPTIKENACHEYIEDFLKKDQKYLWWLYTTNRLSEKELQGASSNSKIYNNSGGNNSLVFTIVEEDRIRYDTLRNSVHPNESSKDDGFKIARSVFAKWRAKRMLRKLDLQGDLPKGAMSSVSAKKWGLRVGVLVPESQAQVTIEVFNKRGEHVATVVDADLKKGWNNFEWKRNDLKRGKYKVKITMNEDSISQNFKM